MEMISLIGIIVGIALFIFLCFKGFNLVFSAVLATIVVAVFSGMNILETLTGPYMATASGFLKGYMLLFMLSAFFGRMMGDGGAVRRIALALVSLTRRSKAAPKFWAVMTLPIFYFILSYVGISGFVLVFTIVAIGRELFEEMDVPWIFYAYGSAGILPAILLGGNLQAINIMATQGFEVPATAAFGFSLVLMAVAWIVLVIILKLDIKKYEKLNEGFLPSGEVAKQIKMAAPIPEDQLPGTVASFIPLIIPVVCIAVFKLDVLTALLIATIVGFILFHKNYKNIKGTITDGVTAAFGPVITVAMTSGLVAVIKAAPAYVLIGGFFDSLPGILGGVSVVFVMSAVVGSSSSALPAFMPYIVERFTAAGVSNAVAARMVTASCSSYMVPHCPGVVNAIALTRLNFKKAAWMYFKTTCIPGFIAMVVGVLMITVGIVG